ncbi:MAG: TetR/AcrR family transcriptional regulator [Propionibacteriales bacterium]|nr:TetR/AcrR family transcriptional regulator [Propionibacteriales bacterium]
MPTRRGPGRPATISTQKILDTAEDVGLTNLTRAAVAERLGVSAGTIRHHVESTHRLYSLTAARIFARLDLEAEEAATWQHYLLTLGRRFAALVTTHPGVDDYVLRGPYERTTLDQFERILDELARRDPDMPRHVAYLLGSRTLTLSATLYATSLDRYPAGTTPPPGPYAEVVDWTLRAFLRGAGQLLDEDEAPVLQPTPDARWTHIRDDTHRTGPS